MDWNIIGIHGSISAGKNVLTQLLDWSAAGLKEPFKEWVRPKVPYLQGEYYNILAFADPLKEDLAKITKTDREQWEDRDFKTSPLDKPSPKCFRGMTPREVMEEYAQALRDRWRDIWVDRTMQEFQKGKPHIFTDVRHPNERELIQNLGGVVLGIRRYQTPSQWVWTLSGERLNLSWKQSLIPLSGFRKLLQEPLEEWSSAGFTPQIQKTCMDRLTHQSGKHDISCDHWVENKGTIESLMTSFYQVTTYG